MTRYHFEPAIPLEPFLPYCFVKPRFDAVLEGSGKLNWKQRQSHRFNEILSKPPKLPKEAVTQDRGMVRALPSGGTAFASAAR
jgi:hypothetical protein